ncbi:MAG TPA: hypothetical protein VIU37_03315 [Candidatus Limnocylindrales bacterium]
MIRRAFAAAALLALVALPLPVGADIPRRTLETQAWWNTAGLTIPGAVGQHVHLRANVPVDWTPLDGVVSVHVKVTLHNQTGKATSFRVSDGSTVKQSWSIALGPCADCVWEGDVNVDFSKWSTGRREMRWTANIPSNDEGNRQYNSTGWQVCVRSCSPTYRSGEWIEARGWYTGRGYQNARITSALSTVREGGVVKVKLAPGSGGLATTFSAAYLDPDFHHGSAGRVLLTRSSSYSGTVTIPSDLAAGAHTLVLLASDGKNAGVLAVPFTAP